MSPQEIIDFFKENGSVILRYPFVFASFALLCVCATAAFLGWRHRKEKAALQEQLSHAQSDAGACRRELDALMDEKRVLEAEVTRLKAQFKKMTLEGYIAASRETPEGTVAEHISGHIQNRGTH